MNNLLQKDKPIYHRFVDNQVLTDDQLNAVLDHLNYQDRITRTKLIGVGIVCGLEIYTLGDKIALSGGTAVTTEGELIKVEDTIFEGFKIFKDEHVKYDHFLDGDETMTLYELMENTDGSDVENLGNFEAATGISVKDLVGLIYLECYEKEPEDCSPIECNAQGKEVVKKIRILVTSLSIIKKIVQKDSILQSILNGGMETVLTKLQKNFAKRVILNTGNTSSLSQFKKAYQIDFKPISDSILSLSQINLFATAFGEVDFDIVQKLENIQQSDHNFQYIYDFYKDLITACNELLACLKENMSICCPDPTAFPYHIALGELQRRPIVYRHDFYPSPTHDHKKTLTYLHELYRRIIDMIKFFVVSNKNDIRLTPSIDTDATLGLRALPVYYDLDKSAEASRILVSWRPSVDDLILNYYGKAYPTLDFDPLDYCLDRHNFYRVEGHIGKNISSALKDLTGIRDSKGLPFNIMPVAIGSFADEATIDYTEYNVFFEDLQIILQAWNEEMKCIVAGSTKFLTGFSIVNPGLHYEYAHALLLSQEENPISPNANTAAEGIVVNEEIINRSFFGGQQKMINGKMMGKSNTVVDNIVEIEDSTGYIWQEIIGVADNANDIQVKLSDLAEEHTLDWAKELKYAVVEAPSKMLGVLKATEDNKLLSIEDFTEENLEKYIDSLEQQCKTAKEEKKKLQAELDKADSELQGQAYIEQYFFVMNNIISSCCFIERFKVLYQEILDRKEELLNSLVLKKFIQDHPGAEHRAGVVRGGTFVLLYYSKAKNKPVKDAAITDLQAAAKEMKFYYDGFMKTSKKLGLSGPDQIAIASEIDTPKENFVGDVEAFVLGQEKGPASDSIADGTVVGDLYLPYLCCSNTPAMSFVFPEQKIDFYIEHDAVCKELEKEVELVLISPTPKDAEVQAMIGASVIENSIQSKDGKQYFDPNVVPVDDYGKTISFQVNGQDVDPVISIYLKPSASFRFGIVSYSNQNTKASVTIENTSVPIDGQKFTWKIEDKVLENTANVFDFDFNVKPGGLYKFNFKLSAANGPCTDVVSDILEIEVPELDEGEQNECAKFSIARIENSLKSIDTFIALNKPILGILPAYFATDMMPIYEMILKDTSVSLSGELDKEICALMEQLVAGIGTRLETFDGVEGRALLICMYLETIQLYFFIQRCREAAVTSKQGVTNRISKIVEEFTGNHPEALMMALKDKEAIENFNDILETMGDRMSNTLRNSIADTIEILKGFIG